MTGLVGLGTSVGEEVSEGEGMKLVTLETRGAQIAPLKFVLHWRKTDRVCKAALQARGINGEKARFGHFFYRVTQTFAAEARVLCAAVRHVVDPEGGNFTDHQAAHL